ncbi:hypothetical protein MNBD_BACTEROID03-1676, partial [hydrothermal vent metagenome]
MSFLAKLYMNGRAINVLDTNVRFYQQLDPTTFQPTALPNGGIFTITIEADGSTDMLRLMLSQDTMCNGHIRFYKRDGMSKLVDYEFFDTHVVSFHSDFDSNSNSPATDTCTLSPGILRIGDMVFEKWWKVTDLSREKAKSTLAPIPLQPKLSSVKWKSTEGESVEEIEYDGKVALQVKVANPEGGSVAITIEKEDGSEFEGGKKSLSFTEYLTEEGVAELSTFKIKKEWEEGKTAEIDKLIAKVTHKGSSKKSGTLQITPKPKATLHFRPHSAWSGEYGFDWMRKEDTSIGGDVDYEKNVGEYGTTYATQSGAVFTAKDYTALENEYNPTNINNRKDTAGNPIQYYTPWLTIYRKANATTPPQVELELLTEVDVAPDELYLEFSKKYFDVTGAVDSPKDATLKQYKLPAAMNGVTAAGSPNETKINLQCIHTLPQDETIKVWAVKNKANGTPDTPILSGKLTIRANDKANRRIGKIVFVNVQTNINGATNPIEGIRSANKTTQEDYLAPFLKQALVKPDVANEDLKLFDNSKPEVQTLNTDYILFDSGTGKNIFHKYNNSGGASLVEFLTQQFETKPANAQYASHYKVFFLGEPGGRMSGAAIVGLGGHANGISSKECVMYANPMPFFVAHELMHCMGLYHSFDNDGTHTFKIGQTEN